MCKNLLTGRQVKKQVKGFNASMEGDSLNRINKIHTVR